MKTSFSLIISILLFLSVIGCGNNTVTPEEDQPGRRDYEWTVDTLNYPYSPIYRIWGSSPTNVWAISPGDIGRNIFHYDGNKWSTDGVMRFIAPSAIWGFSSDNVYIGGSGGQVWKYDGNDWKEVAVLQKDGNEEVVFDNIWGESPNDFYAFALILMRIAIITTA